MNAPPDHEVATADVPVTRSSTPIRLVPGPDGEPCVADHEIMVWVTSCVASCQLPEIEQSVRGFLASVTSATTGLAPPWSFSSASALVGGLAQLACMAAQAGTTRGTGDGDGLGDGEGDGLG